LPPKKKTLKLSSGLSIFGYGLEGKRIGRKWKRHILQVCNKYFLYEQVENFNEPNLDTWNDYDDGMDLLNYDFNNDGLAWRK
jgi:hypothetical protein